MVRVRAMVRTRAMFQIKFGVRIMLYLFIVVFEVNHKPRFKIRTGSSISFPRTCPVPKILKLVK